MKTSILIILCLAILSVSVMSNDSLFGKDFNDMTEFLQTQSQESRKQDDAATADAAKEGDAAADDKKAEEGGDAAATKDAGAAAGSADPKDALTKEGWLKVSSMGFPDTIRHPGLPLEDGHIEPIALVDSTTDLPGGTDKQKYFRSNTQFGKDKEIKNQADFYFRLSGRNLYYTETKTDMRVLGAIAVKNINSVAHSHLSRECFTCTNDENDEWDICAEDEKGRDDWVNSISKALGLPVQTDAPAAKPEKEVVTVVQKQPVYIMAQPSPFCNEDWNYVDHGFGWGCKCKEGGEQSPVAVVGGGELLNKSASFEFNQVPIGQLELVWEDSILKLRDPKFSEDNFEFVEGQGFGRVIDIDYYEYLPREIHFHVPAEHTYNGKEYPMEVQVMMVSKAGTDIKKHAVLSFFVEQIPGGSNKVFDKFDFLDLPNVFNTNVRLPTPEDSTEQYITIEDFWRKDAGDTFHGYFNYVTYEGSRTSPPCSEHYKYFVVEEPLQLGFAALEMFRDAIQNVPHLAGKGKGSLSVLASDMAPTAPAGNNRDLQALGNRTFSRFDLALNDCYPQPEKKKKMYGDGHYERVRKNIDTFVYIPNLKPTGLPGALVVTKEEATGKELQTEDSNQNE